MYTEIGSFDAKAKLSALLREVQRGQRYTITLRGRPVADLVPSGSAIREDAHAAIESMRNIRKVCGVSPANISDWVVEGRR
ncbi:MAG: type II toxin-antitoxin system prevent-host-death family antitoxin [Verrucomicrobia subdivision 3 bacterium]|nr:type II toxin-antitoxin system prevent-host-death family antitoxin [Limisphaerales bacterium]